MNFRVLCALLLVYRANFQMLHWLAKGKSFDRMHKIANDYYDKCLDAADTVAELGMRLDQRPPGYLEAVKIIENQEDKILVLESGKDFEYGDFVKYACAMLNDIVSSIELLLDDAAVRSKSNVGIKAELENLHNQFDHEARYLNNRRSED